MGSGNWELGQMLEEAKDGGKGKGEEDEGRKKRGKTRFVRPWAFFAFPSHHHRRPDRQPRMSLTCTFQEPLFPRIP
jgi:hypothetical protein